MNCNCQACGTEVKIMGKGSTHWYEPVDKHLIAKIYDIPFYCETCGAIKFPRRAIRGVVYIWPLYKELAHKDSCIIIPESLKKAEYTDIGIILSHGPGFYGIKAKAEIWTDVIGLSVGMKVVYDKDVPWGETVKANDGKGYYVRICDVTDIMVELVE